MVYEKTLCYGTLNPDLIYFIDDLPEAGGDIRSNGYNIRAGGTAINCAENIANWGTSVSVLGNSICLLYTSPSPRDGLLSRMPSSA